MSLRESVRPGSAVGEGQESRSPYEVICRFTAHAVQQKQGFATNTRVMEEATTVWADPAFWKDKLWKGKLVVLFLYNDRPFYVDRLTFVSSTRKISV